MVRDIGWRLVGSSLLKRGRRKGVGDSLGKGKVVAQEHESGNGTVLAHICVAREVLFTIPKFTSILNVLCALLKKIMFLLCDRRRYLSFTRLDPRSYSPAHLFQLNAELKPAA